MAGVKEVSSPVKDEDSITLAPKLTEINRSYLKEASRSFFSKISKDFSNGIFEYFLFIQSLSKKDIEQPASSKLRTAINFLKKAKDIWDFLQLFDGLLSIASFLAIKLMEAQSTVSQNIGKGIYKFISPLLDIRSKISNFFTFKKKDVDTGVKPVIKDKKPSFSFGNLSPFKSKKSLLFGVIGAVGGSLVVHKIVTDIKEGETITIKKVKEMEDSIESAEDVSSSEKLNLSKNLYFSLLSKEYEIAGNKEMSYLLQAPSYELANPVTVEEITIISSPHSMQRFLRKSDVSLPWLRLWNQFLEIVKDGLAARTDITRYQSAVSSLTINSEDAPPPEKADEVVQETGYKELSLQDFAKASLFEEVVAIAERGKFNLMDEGKRVIASKEKEIAAQTRKYNNWVGILGLLSLKLNNQ